MILPKFRDPRLVTIRRGGTLTDSDHRLLALWAASCAEHILGLFETARPVDRRPRQSIDAARAWVRGELTMTQARTAAGYANGAAGDAESAARLECQWQHEQLPEPIRVLVLDDERLRNDICWFVFD